MDLTSRWQGRTDASAKDGPASADVATGGSGGSAGPDAALGGSGGGAAADGAATGRIDGLATTGGTGGSATDGAAGNVALDAGAVADGASSGDGGIDVPFSGDTNLPVDQGTGGSRTDGAVTGGTGGTGMGGAKTGGAGGTATGGTGGTVTDAGTKADAISSGDGKIDVPFFGDTRLPSDLGAGGSDGAGTGGTGGTATGGTATGGTATGGTTGPMIISIRFEGGRTGGASGIVAMDPNDIAGVKPAAHWNSATSNTGTLSSLLAADGSTAIGASVGWSASDTWTAGFTDTTTAADARMMSGYLDPQATASPATVNVTVPSSMTGAYDVYVYCYGSITDTRTRTYQYAIGTTAHSWTQQGPSATTFPGYNLAPEGGTGNNYDYVRFQNVTGSTFTLTATPVSATGGASVRAPVNGIQIVYPAGS